MNKIFKICIYSFLMFLLSFLIIEYGVNNFNQDYKIELSSENANYNDILNNEEYWTNIIVSKEYDISIDIYDSMKIEDGYLIIDGKFINYETANKFLRSLVNSGLSSSSPGYVYNYSTIIINRTNPYIISITLSILVAVILYIKIDKEEVKKHIFSKEYWVSASKETKKVKNLCFMSIILSMQLIAGLIPIPSGFGDLGIGISYLFLATNCMLFGPLNALLIGATGDVLGHFISPKGTFYYGYVISAMLSAFTYAICFYKTKITFTKVLIARIFINLFVNVVLGTYWLSEMFSYTSEMSKSYMLYISLPKNIFYLIPQTLLLFMVFKYIMPVFNKLGIIEDEYKDTKII